MTEQPQPALTTRQLAARISARALADPDCERCDGSGLDPDKYTTSENAEGQTVYHLTEPCSDCIGDEDKDEEATP